MKKIIVLGAGLVSRPLVKYLLGVKHFFVTLADIDEKKAAAIIDGAANGRAVALDVSNQPLVEELVREHDLAISLLPYSFHPMIAEYCIRHKKNMVTASYVSEKMKSLHPKALEAGVIILNEIGVDPGIDHMSAMKIIDSVHGRGGKIEAFRSYCGGLPAPEDTDNPFGYKFSWSPRGVLMAGLNSAKYLEKGKIVDIDGRELFLNHWGVEVGDYKDFETYPNRDSLPYVDIYGIQETETMFRGTIRNKGWCDKLYALAKMGFLKDETVDLPQNATYKDLTAKMIGADNVDNLTLKTHEFLGKDSKPGVLDGLKWLGLFQDQILPRSRNLLDIMTELFLSKMEYKAGERDMIVLFHDFMVSLPEGKKRITSTLIDYGLQNGDTSMARTVGLPAAIGAELILNGKISLTGVQIPVSREIYLPVLARLEELNIKCVEQEYRI
ncbi:MAG: saccharopine dehydrogenase NADP-binding domain-containing protein [Candidatus Marinimicrobia bacterium]|nr:saccharopine dehydrogenase NADP-binding domain-containing protein [Candidatus Neomarinimicrobiota bacterium]